MKNHQKISKQVENSNIAHFISKLNDKNYSHANNYLRSIIENKLLRKINISKNIPIF